MKALVSYLNFDGQTREAMTFYAKCLDAQLETSTFKDMGMDSPPGAEDRVIHARLSKGSMVLMASDSMPGQQVFQGNNFWVMVDCDNGEEVDRLFKAFGEGGKVVMEVQDTFWNARFGMLKDRFGTGWMFNADMPKKD
jgi:Uncharacterized protein conserved in bacteria